MSNALRKIICIVLLIFAATPAVYAEKIVAEGSTTLLPLVQRAAEEFMAKNPAANISVRGGGSGVGIASLIDGICDIANASRALKDIELEKAVSSGCNPKAHIVAIDGIAVLVHPSNPVSALSQEQIKDIFIGRITNWKELGGKDEKIVVVSRENSSGTFETFKELALNQQKIRRDALALASNQAVAATISRTPAGIGYAGIAFISPAVKALSIGGVMPTEGNVMRKKYPFSRYLYMYTNGKPEGLVKNFLDFMVGSEGQRLADQLGYVSIL